MAAALVTCAGLLQPLNAYEDACSEPELITDGYQPDIAVDADSGAVHLLFIREGRVFYKVRMPGEAWSPDELLFDEAFYDRGGLEWDDSRVDFFDPRLKLDADGVPHLVIQRGLWRGSRTYYTNRLGGAWKAPLRFPSENIVVNRSATPDLAIAPDGRVYLTAFNLSPVNNWIVRLAAVETEPVIEAQAATRFGFGNASIMINEAGELWLFGGNHGDVPWQLQQFDPDKLERIGDPIDLAPLAGEQARATMDHQGEIHAAGGRLWGVEDPATIGWYQTRTRGEAKLQPLRFVQHMGHACGAVLPVRDRVAEDRVYLFAWSGERGNKHNEIGPLGEYNFQRSWFLFPGQQLRFTRVEGGAIVSAHRPVTQLPGAHGPSYRNTPAAAALPGGGVAVVFCRAATPEADTSELYYTEIGRPQ